MLSRGENFSRFMLPSRIVTTASRREVSDEVSDWLASRGRTCVSVDVLAAELPRNFEVLVARYPQARPADPVDDVPPAVPKVGKLVDRLQRLRNLQPTIQTPAARE